MPIPAPAPILLAAAWLALAAPVASAQDRCTEVSVTSPAPRNAAARSAASCTGCDAEGVVTVTFRFASEVPCGAFADGTPWVADEGAGVSIVGMDPPVTGDCGASTCNGWMVDVSGNGQALDGRRSFDAAALPPVADPSPSAPFVAAGSTSILKAVSFQDEVVGADCSDASVLGSEPRHCLYFATVLTVLDAVPPDGTGAGYFRPPYVGRDKPLIPVSDARLDRLPRLPTGALEPMPSREAAETDLCQVPLSFMGTYRNQYFKAYLNVGSARGYHGYVSRDLGDDLLRALFADRTERMGACIVQRGIDLYHMALPPVEVAWGPNGGHGQGRTMWPALAAALLGRDDWAATYAAMPASRFAERSQVYYSPVADPDGARGEPGEVLYGAHPAAGGTSMCTTGEYFGRCYPDWPGSCNRVCADPFGYIDGGSPGSSYQEIFSPAARAFALAAHLAPDLRAAWPRDGGRALFLEYVDRWVTHGAWTMADPCDAADPLDPASPPDCTSGAIGTCVCRPGAGRYPDRHGRSADGGTAYRSAFTTAVWAAFRECARDCTCEGMEGLCEPAPPRTDAGTAARDGGGAPDGSAPTGDGGGGVGADGGGAAPPAESVEGGCGCAVTPRSAVPHGWLGVGLLLLFRRRRGGARGAHEGVDAPRRGPPGGTGPSPCRRAATAAGRRRPAPPR